ncbi:major facilitator superfamily domain-containing protein 6-like isoform X1 [Macrobrachium rosenbergii]|uniref:major facilitator superfamily domain-containing protein 6-like isoform X1 n=1 Tax=Macrobrachium rosenbergii TaxID=79674 RepID=UPI0034D51514
MRVNRKLLPIKTHYFLQYAGSAFMTMVLPLIVRQKGVPAQGIGVVFTVLPIVGLFVNSLAGTLADYFRAHKIIFLATIASITYGFTSIYYLSNIPGSEMSYLSILATRGNNSQTTETAAETGEFPDKTRRETHLPHIPSFLGHDVTENKELFIPRIAPELATEKELVRFLSLNTTNEEGDDEGDGEDNSRDFDFSNLVRLPQFWLIFLSVMAAHIGLNLSIMMADSVCFQLLDSEGHKYGQQRLWGALGMGSMAIVVGAIVDKYSEHLPKPDYFPAVVVAGVFLTLDFLVVARMDIPYAKDIKVRIRDVGSVLRRPQVILFLVAIYVISTSLGMLWVFKMLMIEDVALKWNSDFRHLKLLQGLALSIETFGGEIPFFFFSGAIILSLGHTVVLSISMASMAFRCCLYFFVSNPWWFLPIELLNGPSYGLFYAVMASYASHVAPPGAQATLQAITRAGFSLGLSTAGCVGGILYISLGGGGSMYLVMGLFDFAFCVLYYLLNFGINRCCRESGLAWRGGYEVADNKLSVEMETRMTGADATSDEREIYRLM